MLLTKRLTIIPLFAAISIFSCQEPLSVKTQEQLNISLGLIEKKVPTEHLILESFYFFKKKPTRAKANADIPNKTTNHLNTELAINGFLYLPIAK